MIRSTLWRKIYFSDDAKPDQSYASQNGGPKSSLIQQRDETKKSEYFSISPISTTF